MVRLGTVVPHRIGKEVDEVHFLHVFAGSWTVFNLNTVGIVPVLRQTLLRKKLKHAASQGSSRAQDIERMSVLY